MPGRKPIPKDIRRKVYAMYDGHCVYCGRHITYEQMQVDHIHPHYLGGKDSIDNYHPACRRCNMRKDTLNIEAFRHEIEMSVKRLRQREFNFRLAEDYNLIKEVNTHVVFWFERHKKRYEREKKRHTPAHGR